MIYNLLPFLMNKGLIKRVEMEERELYQAVSPEVLGDLAQKTAADIREIIPILKTRQAENNAVPQVQVYDNPLSMREWYRQYMKKAQKGEKLLVWSTGQENYWYQMDKEFYEEYLEFSEKSGLRTMVILPQSKEAKKYQQTIGREHTEVKFNPHGFDKNAEKWIWNNQICYLTIRGNATNMIVLESKELADLEKANFNQIWKSIK